MFELSSLFSKTGFKNVFYFYDNFISTMSFNDFHDAKNSL